MKLKTSNRKFKSLVNVILLMSPNITDHTSRWDAASFREICQQKSHFISLPFAFSTFFFAPQDLENSHFRILQKYISFFCIFEKHVVCASAWSRSAGPQLILLFLIAGHQIMDHYGVLGRRLCPGPDEGRQIWREPYSNHFARGVKRLGLLAFRNEIASRHQRYTHIIKENAMHSVNFFF